MPRSLAWFVFAFGMACVAWGPAATTAQQKNDPKVDPNKKVDPKADPNKKVDPKAAQPKVDPKTPPKVDPKAQPKTEPKAQPKPADPKTPDPAPEPEPEPLPVDGPPNPLDLVRGLRSDGLSDLAIDLIGELEQNPKTPGAVKAELPLERARCLLEAADDEPDEATRLSLVGEAKDGFNTFLKKSPGPPRAAEPYLALARLTSLEAKAQLAKSKRVDVPAEDGPEKEEAVKKQRAEAAAARPLFDAAAKQFKSAAEKIGAQLEKGVADPITRRGLIQSKIDAELASGINLMARGDTYVEATADEKKDRSSAIEAARGVFNNILGQKETPARVSWVARAWMAECEFQKDNNKVAEEEFQRVLRAGANSEDGKRVAKFFQIRHKVIVGDGKAVEKDGTDWLKQYGSNRKAQGEANAVRWYVASVLQAQGEQLSAPPKGAPMPKTPAPLNPGAALKFKQAERLYREITQSDNEYSHRASKRRMYVVRRLLGEADKAPAEYKTFEEAQMASLIQIAKLIDQEKGGPPADEDARKKYDAAVKERTHKIVALLEHAREIASEKDNPSDVNEVLLRLIYFYGQDGQPQRAAVLGEYIARNVRAGGGKSAAAGMLGVGAFVRSAATVKGVTDAAELEAIRRADRDRALRLARFLDEKFPNDTATDAARHQLAGLLFEDGKPVDAFDASLKVRPGYDRIAYVRLFEGAVASRLLTGKDSPLPAERRTDVYRRAVSDLEKLPAPPPETADDDDARTYLSVRARLAFLYLIQSRVDPEAEKAEPGYAKAAKIAEEAAKAVPTYKSLMADDKKAPNVDGWEALLAAEDARTRAVFLEATALFAAGKYDEVFAPAGKVLAEMNERGPMTEAVKEVPGEDAKKARVAELAKGIDKLRGDLVVLALKTRVQQGQADKGVELLDLLKRFGGSIEANVATLERLTLEMSGRIEKLRRDGKAAEATALADGFGKLLEKVSAEPNLPPSVQLFLGQALIVVGKYAEAEAALARVPRPADAAALAAPATVMDENVRRQAGQFRRATLDLVRARRMGKKFDEADKLLAESMGTKEKQGWAFSSLDFRKEVAYLAEARGTEEKDPKAASKHWGAAVKEWTGLLSLARNRAAVAPPKDANGNDDNATIQRNKNAFFDAYFDYNRCILKANLQLLAGNPKLDERVKDTAKRFVELEQKEGQHMTVEVKTHYHDLIVEVPALRREYEAAGGKMFLQDPTGG
jgi:hypothetical protein